MPQFPKVTILIANHNYGHYISDAINSAISQEYDPNALRICIMDDGSSDKSWQIIHNNFLKNIPHTKDQLTNPNGFVIERKIGKMPNGIEIHAYRIPQALGPSEARNIGIHMNIEDSFAFGILDADDAMYKDKTLKCVAKILEAPDVVGVVYGDYDNFNVETGNIIREYKEPFDKIRLYHECIVHSGSFINSKALIAVRDQFGYYDREMRTCEDYDLWLRISEKFMIIHVPEALTFVRIHRNNSTFGVRKEIWEQNWRRIQQKLTARNG